MAEKGIKKFNASLPIPLSLLTFPCEWDECKEAFKCLDALVTHMTQHLTGYFSKITEPLTENTVFLCQWRECNSQITGKYSDFFRHAYFHVFHVKIKSIGSYLISKTGARGCLLDDSSRNLIPELPDRLQCGWKYCEVVYDIPEYFYRHVDNHSDSFPEGKNVLCSCSWEGCEAVIKSKYKMKEHLRSHTQEKIIACPTCGGLFSNRTKLLDHLRRQEEGELQCYQCSHCNKRFATERLLRDHMRHHVNHYKCPYCEMTCPAPSSLKNHIRYRHTEEKPFKCEHCNYCGKSSSDLHKHLESHLVESQFGCHIAKCNYTARTYSSLVNHFKRFHQSIDVAKYVCHVCDTIFTRGTSLTKHLKVKHKFRWPSGHSRFRYRLDGDGFWRLQTVRYESIQLTEQVLSDPSNPDDESGPSSMSSDANLGSNQNIPVTENDSENMSYNLEMLGEVALSVPNRESLSKEIDYNVPVPVIDSQGIMSLSSPVTGNFSDSSAVTPAYTALMNIGKVDNNFLALQRLHNKKEYNS